MQVNLLIIITIFSTFILMGIGFIIGRLSKQDNYLVVEDKLREIEKKRDKIIHNEENVREFIDNKKREASGYAQPGIVYRPSAEELEKMHEPQKIREAKEAVAETIRNTPLPEEI